MHWLWFVLERVGTLVLSNSLMVVLALALAKTQAQAVHRKVGMKMFPEVGIDCRRVCSPAHDGFDFVVEKCSRAELVAFSRDMVAVSFEVGIVRERLWECYFASKKDISIAKADRSRRSWDALNVVKQRDLSRLLES